MSATDTSTLPHSEQAEQALLSCLLRDPSRLADCGALGRNGDAEAAFYDHRHKVIFESITCMAKTGRPVDVITVTAALNEAGKLDDAGGPSYITSLLDVSPTAQVASEHAATVSRHAQRRRVMDISERLRMAASERSDLGAALEAAQQQLTNIAAAGRGNANVLPRQNAIDLLEKEFVREDEIVTGVITARSRNIISAVAKLGKTRFSLGLAVGVALGQNVMGLEIPRPRRVLYFLAEGGERMLQRRLEKMLARGSYDRDLLRENLILCCVPTLKLTNPAHAERIQRTIQADKGEFAIFDPLYKFNAGDENSVRDMTAFFDVLDRFMAECGVAILLNHHHGKGTGENFTTEGHLNRGCSTITDWADSLLTLTWENKTKEIVKLRFSLRHGEEPPPMAFERNTETLWFDPLSDYQFSSRAHAVKITEQAVVETIGARGQVSYTQLCRTLREKFRVAERTAKDAIRRAVEAGTIRKTEGGLYERV